MIESIEVQSWTEEDHTTVEVLIRPPADDFGPGLISWLELISESRAVDSYERRPSKGGKGYPGGTGQRGPY